MVRRVQHKTLSLAVADDFKYSEWLAGMAFEACHRQLIYEWPGRLSTQMVTPMPVRPGRQAPEGLPVMMHGCEIEW
jgi:hypothetical protein